MSKTIAVGVSACLLGEKVRYDGGHKRNPNIADSLARSFALVAVCPEVECGMGIPREPMRLEGDPANPRLVTIEGRADKSGQMLSYCLTRMAELENAALCGFILKGRSPSCGLAVDVYRDGIPACKGRGLFAAALAERFPHLPLVEEEGLGDPEARAAFIQRVLACHCRK